MGVSEYLDEAIMEEETKSAGDGDEGLLELQSNGIAHDGLDVRADIGVVVLPQLSRRRERAEAQADGQRPRREELERGHRRKRKEEVGFW